jgi:hypothetical protein
MSTYQRFLLALLPFALCLFFTFPRQLATHQNERFLIVENIHSKKSQDQIREKTTQGYRMALIAPQGDVTLLEHNANDSGKFAYDFVECPNLWKKDECESVLNREGAAGFRVLPVATDTVDRKVWFGARFVGRFVLEKSPESGTYSYAIKNKQSAESHSPVALVFTDYSTTKILSEHSSDAAVGTGVGSYLKVGPEDSRKLIKKLNDLGARGYRLFLWTSYVRLGGPQFAIVHIPAESGISEYALLSTKDAPEIIRQRLDEQGAKGFHPLAIAPDQIVLERAQQTKATRCSYQIVSAHNNQSFSTELEKYLDEGYRLTLLVALDLRASRFMNFGDVQYDSSPIVILEKCD